MTAPMPEISQETARQATKTASGGKRVVYLSGPMTGLPDFNRQAFNKPQRGFERADIWYSALPNIRKMQA